MYEQQNFILFLSFAWLSSSVAAQTIPGPTYMHQSRRSVVNGWQGDLLQRRQMEPPQLSWGWDFFDANRAPGWRSIKPGCRPFPVTLDRGGILKGLASTHSIDEVRMPHRAATYRESRQGR
jgi:hypothetical protein